MTYSDKFSFKLLRLVQVLIQIDFEGLISLTNIIAFIICRMGLPEYYLYLTI